MTPFLAPQRERGAALLSVLLLVAIVGAIAAGVIERLRLATALAGNTASLEQARSYAIGMESLLSLRIDDLLARDPDVLTLDGGWNGRSQRLDVAGGRVDAVVRDGGNCFNLNSLVQGESAAAVASRPTGIAQFAALMRYIGIPEHEARRVADSAADWADSDGGANPNGAEDPVYAGMASPYRTSNTLFADASELRAVAGVSADLYDLLRPWLCALPTTELSPINLNSLTPDQAPLLAMLAPQRLSLQATADILANRPAGGWKDLAEFYSIPAMKDVVPPSDALYQPQLKTRWFTVRLDVDLGSGRLVETALVDARVAPSRAVRRTWGDES